MECLILIIILGVVIAAPRMLGRLLGVGRYQGDVGGTIATFGFFGFLVIFFGAMTLFLIWLFINRGTF